MEREIVTIDKKDIKKIVRKNYADIATQKKCCCSSPCTSPQADNMAEKISKNIGYTDEELQTVPEGANLGLGCGNPVALASLKQGEVVLDLGSGAGFDCFLAAQRVGTTGKIIGVDMTPEMVNKARENAKKGGYQNVEFRLGEIEHLPVDDASVDVIISNCVINLSPDKDAVFHEAFRVLKPGGRFLVSDIVLLKKLPEQLTKSVAAYVGCISGAMLKDQYLNLIKDAGFTSVRVVDQAVFSIDWMANDPTAQALIKKEKLSSKRLEELGTAVISMKVEAVKP